MKNIKLFSSTPSILNEKLKNGYLDISIISSAEYLLNSNNYFLISDLSITSKNKIKSVFLFSKIPFDELDGISILITNESLTSKLLIQIILKYFFLINPVYKNFNITKDIYRNEKTIAFLIIGDQALYFNNKVIQNEYPFVMDLGEEWYKQTKLPFVFAVWAINKRNITNNRILISYGSKMLKLSKEKALLNLDKISDIIVKNKPISYNCCFNYLSNLNYHLDNNCISGLKLFFKYLKKIKKIKNNPDYNFFIEKNN